VTTERAATAAGPAEKALPSFSGDWALFLDVDGTLLDFADHPDAVVTPARLREILQRIFRCNGGALALVSGRRLADLDRLFQPFRYPAAGQHGLERRDVHGTVTRMEGVAERLNAAARALEVQARGVHGVLVEHKGLTLAIHYRRAPHLRDWAASAARTLLTRLGDEFRSIEGKMVFEIKPSGKDKGVAIAEFMREAPFAGRLPVFVGDDATDEDGFAVVNALHGLSIKVGPGVSVACCRTGGADGVRRWLEGYADHLDRGAAR
jgi:trehalose 6-phosphate phosphatase